MLSIAEGASTYYVPELIRLNRTDALFDLFIGARFPDGLDPSAKYRKRIDQAFRDGIIEELSNNLKLYEQSYLIREYHAAVPAIDYLRGACSFEEDKLEILKRCLSYGRRQLSLFSSLKDVCWIDGGHVTHAVDVIVQQYL